MSKKKSTFPKLFQRTEGGSYCFRLNIQGKPTRINTQTSDDDQAKEFLQSFMAAHMSAEVAHRQRQNASQIAHKIIKDVSGNELERLPLEEAWGFWLQHTPDFNNNSERYQNQMKLYFSKFVAWCHEQKSNYIDEVDISKATCYSGVLKAQNMTAKTFNENRKILSRVFASIHAFKQLPNGNPFNPNIVAPQPQPVVSEATHQPLEPNMMSAVINAAAEAGQDWLDLFIVGAQTGMRLKDAALFRWEFIKGDFIEFRPEKTIGHGNLARIPISPTLARLLEQRHNQNQPSPYVNPIIAQFYQNSDWPSKKSKKIFEAALGKEKTQFSKKGKRRQRNGCIYSFHSFRATLMSVLAAKQTPVRDAMTIFGWESMEMVRIYTKMLEHALGEMDARNKKLFDTMPELNFRVPEVEITPERLEPTKKALQLLITQHSNQTIGLIYDISNVMVKNWMVKFGIVRTRRIIDNGIDEESIIKIRQELLAA